MVEANGMHKRLEARWRDCKNAAARARAYAIAVLANATGGDRLYRGPSTAAAHAALASQVPSAVHGERDVQPLDRALAAAHGLTGCGLIKADVQGAELEVLSGAPAALAAAEAVLLELSVAQYNEGAAVVARVAQMDAWGYAAYDVAELSYSRSAEARDRHAAFFQMD